MLRSASRKPGSDPIFRLVDGATCPGDDVSTLRAKRRAYKLLIDKGLIRIGLSIPATAEFKVELAAMIPMDATPIP